jgi:hypothetical protein
MFLKRILQTILFVAGVVIVVFFTLAVAQAQSLVTEATNQQTPTAKLPTLWKWSAATLVAGTTTDFVSSVGWNEANPNLRSPDGKFSVRRGLALKGASAGVFLIGEYFLIRKWPQLAKPFAYINFGASAGYGGLAASNWARHP